MKLVLTILLFIFSTSISSASLGVVDVRNPTNITFSKSLNKNYSEAYQFTLTDKATLNYVVNTQFDGCVKGCGKPTISYGIYDSFGKQIDNSGTVVLSSGTYFLGIKTTGMGANNSISYNGQITFVSPVPEPNDYLLFFTGIILVVTGVVIRKTRII